MLDFINKINWGEYVSLLETGDPPLILQLLFLNTIYMIWWIVRRWQGKRAMNPATASTIQLLLLAANMFILFKDRINFDAILDQFVT